jgi:hypothetical protein
MLLRRSLLSLFALLFAVSAALAQNDSLALHFSLGGPGIFWNFETMISTPKGPILGSYHNGSIVFDLNTRMTLPNNNAVCINCGTPNSLSFTIDRSAQLYKNMVVKYEMQTREGDGMQVIDYELHFGDLPFTRQDSLLTLQAKQHAGTFATLHVLYSGPTPNGMESGSWDSSGSANFNLTTDIILPAGSAAVRSIGSSAPLQLIQNDHQLHITFGTSDAERELSITNILGEPVATQKLAPNSSSVNITAPAGGCYLARVNDSVVKFVVAE